MPCQRLRQSLFREERVFIGKPKAFRNVLRQSRHHQPVRFCHPEIIHCFARSSAKCIVLTGEPARLKPPAICIKQLESLATTYSTPLFTIRASFSCRIAFEISPYLTEKVPPKPQQVSGASISIKSTSRTARISRRGWSDTPSSRSR